MGNYIARGAPARYAHHGLIEKAPKESNRISCSKCKHYMNDDKSCIKRQLFIPTAGYDQWKYCKYLELIDEMNTQQMRAIVGKVKRSTAQK